MIVAFIPVRGGSKSIPLKNIKPINGRPLIYWTAKAASDCPEIDRVYVATDSEAIRQTVEGLGLPKVSVIGRSPETATDTASTESAMLDFASHYEFDDIVLVQATSPLLTGEDLTGGIALYRREGTDSVLSVVREKRFHWATDGNGLAAPTNYDYRHRPRRQEFAGYLVENGAFYITTREHLLENGNRLYGRIRAYEMAEETSYEIDEPKDFIIIEELLKAGERKDKKPSAAEAAKRIRLVLTDSDGCLTDGGMYYGENGDAMKKFNAKDGMGIRLLREAGILTGIVTGENVPSVRYRAEKLHMEEVHLGIGDKLAVVKEICSRRGIDLSEVAYVGDDVNDLEVLRAVGLPCSVPNAEEEALKAASFVSRRPGGMGAIRDVAEFILKNRE